MYKYNMHILVGTKFGIKLHKLPKRSACKRHDFSEPEQYTVELQNRFEALSTPESNDPENMTSQQDDAERIKAESTVNGIP